MEDIIIANNTPIVGQVEISTENVNVDVQDETMTLENSTELNFHVNSLEEQSVGVAATVVRNGDGTDISSLNHALLTNRDGDNQHTITSITGLRSELDNIQALKRIYSPESGLGEFRLWNDNDQPRDPLDIDRTGYFVKIVPGTDNIAKCSDTDDVYGVTVSYSGFVGNQNNLDRSHNMQYAIVGIIGALRVRTDGTAENGDYVVPDINGIATKSENDSGYKVISQGSYPSYSYVTIAVTPQNDIINRLYDELLTTVGNINLIIGNLNDEFDDISTRTTVTIGDVNDLKDLIEEIKDITDNTNNEVITAKDVANAAQEAARQAIQNALNATADATRAYTAAITAKDEAITAANNALASIANLQDVMTPLSEWTDDNGNSGITGFISQADETRSELATLVSSVGENGTDLTAIRQAIDESGAKIEQLVSHTDKYVIGTQSTSYGLSRSEAQSILTGEYYYIPTYNHAETLAGDDTNTLTGALTVNFIYGGDTCKCYQWNSNTVTWDDFCDVSTATTYEDGLNDGDLWYCWQDVIHNEETYPAGSLYKWEDNKWQYIVTANNDYQGRVLSLVKQTADDVTAEVISARGDAISLGVNLDGINARVATNENYISLIEMESDAIRSGVYTPSGISSNFALLASDTNAILRGTTAGRFHVIYQSFLGTPPAVYNDGDKYNSPPQWNDIDEIFSFEGLTPNNNGRYYFSSADCTKYCAVTDDGYDIYTIGNKVTSALESRISNTEAVVGMVTGFDTDNSASLGNINIQANENGTSITSMASYYYHSLISVSETPVELIENGHKYTSAPVWNMGASMYIFDDNDIDDENGIYYFANTDRTQYCKITTANDNSVLYETYGIGDVGQANLWQKVDENSSAIALVAEHNNITGSFIIGVINDESVATINADRIAFNGDVFVVDDNNHMTGIKGNSITTGSIMSSNYNYRTISENPWNPEEKDTNKIYYNEANNLYHYYGDGDNDIYDNDDWIASNVDPDRRVGTMLDLSNGEFYSKNFMIGSNGDAAFRGHIEATSGSIGGWEIYENHLYISSTREIGDNSLYLGSNGIQVGDYFQVSTNGSDVEMLSLVADRAIISNWYINYNQLACVQYFPDEEFHSTKYWAFYTDHNIHISLAHYDENDESNTVTETIFRADYNSAQVRNLTVTSANSDSYIQLDSDNLQLTFNGPATINGEYSQLTFYGDNYIFMNHIPEVKIDNISYSVITEYNINDYIPSTTATFG